jgi:hypothetical protein
MNNDYVYDLLDFLGEVIDCHDYDDEDKLIEYLKGLGEDKVMDMIREYDQDYALYHMDEYVKQIEFAESIVWIVENYGSSMIEGLNARELWRLVKVIAFQDICKCQYYEIMGNKC